ncbi:MAG TPA: VOC family protein [Longimicrobiales bacterium]|nr:VOC family protein [Longimicrobiales bacterium]
MAAHPQGVVPMLAYADGAEAMSWLSSTFGFEERERWLDANGVLSHGEMSTGHGLIMLATPTPDYEGPRLHRSHCAAAAAWSAAPWVIDGVLVYVDDLAAHFEHAKAAGASLLSGIETGPDGSRLYRVEDLEGHRWMFMQADN